MAVTRRDSRAPAIVRWGGTLLAAGALVALGVITPPGTARASNPTAVDGGGYDQLTGIGSTSSALNGITWASGLRDSSNQPITTNTNGELNPDSDRASNGTTGQLAFMDADFEGLTVNVSQTQDVGHGGVTVSWTWNDSQGNPLGTIRGTGIQAYFLQMMECYGDSNTGPSPEDCEFGAPLSSSSATFAASADQRGGPLCGAPVVEKGPGVGTKDHGPGSAGCDPFEPGEGPTQPGDEPHTDPCGCQATQYTVPFVPVDSSLGAPAYETNDISQYFNAFDSNEVPAATTGPDGTGQQQFETDTYVQAPDLGCGAPEADGSTRDCWLVIVPRGAYEPNGFQLSNFNASAVAANQIVSSPLSAGNWAQRIQVHLSYAALPSFCPPGGKIDSPEMEGTTLVTRAIQSWQTALNQQSNCTRIYHETEVSEQQVTSDFTKPANTDSEGLAYTTSPVGSDQIREGNSAPQLPNIVYVPVAVAGMGFGFHVDEFQQLPPAGTNYTFGYLTQPIKLTQQLVARAVTQVYVTDLPDFAPEAVPPQRGGAFAQKNPFDITHDPVFQQLNPEVEPYGAGAIPLAPFDTVDHSALYQQIWNWIQGDSATSAWLDGGQPASAVTADPDYVSLQIGKNPDFDSMPRAYGGATCPVINTVNGGPQARCSTAVIPYVSSFDAASAAVLTANPSTYDSDWEDNFPAPDGSDGYWGKNGVEPPGQVFIWAVDDTPSLAAYGIIPAELCDNSGANCVSPSAQSVGAAVASAKPDSAGLLEVNPANPGAGAYPLTDIIYAAVRTDEAPQLLGDYADFLSFAVDKGQAGGQQAGDLPAGYLPLPSKLVQQADAAIAKLRQIASGQPSSSASASASSPSGSSPTSGGPATATFPAGSSPQSQTQASSTPAAAPNTAASPSASTSGTAAAPGSTPTGPVIEPPTAQLVAGTTSGQPVGPIRNVIVIVFVIGIAGAGGGLLLRNGRLPRWPGRSRQ